jgi:hypothetical protein
MMAKVWWRERGKVGLEIACGMGWERTAQLRPSTMQVHHKERLSEIEEVQTTKLPQVLQMRMAEMARDQQVECIEAGEYMLAPQVPPSC